MSAALTKLKNLATNLKKPAKKMPSKRDTKAQYENNKRCSVEQHENSDEITDQKTKERRLFIFIIVFLFPLLSIALVGGYGFTIWMYQLLMGPPGAA